MAKNKYLLYFIVNISKYNNANNNKILYEVSTIKTNAKGS